MHQLKAILCRTSTKNSYARHTIKITPNLLFEYQCTSGKFIRLPNRKNRFGSENRVKTFFAQIGMLYFAPTTESRLIDTGRVCACDKLTVDCLNVPV